MFFSASSDCRDADHGLLEWSRGDESIGGGFALLGLIGIEIFDKIWFGAVKRIDMTEF